ncbi:muconolactone delta-isomerase [Rhizobium aethiopicum]|uniref:Muconolactone delta-isomerase n=1 Tax=Rhizobium aethiopicum TaxID=1138170 RepID=A0A7W6QAX1_9HYPH|nr:nickel-binding protein [Rhizobium aethiopicum]MBB4194191.1 muconolactone delta-isomerase [Rhizobium aethiopicum]MBB4581461.1 muconolactone delta-isomerase [Rhizobium aethiopicum]
MPQYMVERHLPGITPQQLSAAAARAKAVTAEMTSQGKPVRYLRSTFVPSEEKSFCLFDAPSAERVEEANQIAQIPLQRIIEVQHIAADDLA